MDEEKDSQESSLIAMAASQPSAPNSLANTVVEFNGGHYKIDHRDTNSLLSVTLQPNVLFYAQSGHMISMSPEMTVKGKFSFSFKELLTNGDMTQTAFTGPGEVLLASASCGDIVPIQLDGQTQWSIEIGALLAMTDGVVKETIFQGFSTTMHRDANRFFNRVSGVGIIFVKSRCAIIERHLKEGEQWIVKQGHLVAWNCPYSLETISDSLIKVIYSMEALVCKFTGPGTVFIHVNK